MKTLLIALALLAVAPAAASPLTDFLQQARAKAVAAGDQAAVDRYDQRISAAKELDATATSLEEKALLGVKLTVKESLQLASKKAHRDEAAAINAREVDHAECRVAAYQAQASDIGDFTVACMRVAGYRLESGISALQAAVTDFKAYCEGDYQPMTTNGRCDNQ